jgi:hypothetical protein
MDKQQKGEHSFSIEMGSKTHLSHVSLSDENKGVLIKGKLGGLIKISHEEGLMVELLGEYGTLRIDLTEEELSKLKEAKK